MIEGMQPVADEKLTVESLCSERIPELWPGDDTRELTRATHETEKRLMIITPKLFKEDLKVAGMFVESWKKAAGDPKQRSKAVWAIDKLMDTESAMKLVADIENERGNHEACKAIYALAARLHSDITEPVGQGLIDEEIADIRQHLRQVLRHKQRGNRQAKDAAAQEAMKIVKRVAGISEAFGSKEQTKELMELTVKKSAFMSAVATTLPSDPAGIEAVCENAKRDFQESMRKTEDEAVPPSRGA